MGRKLWTAPSIQFWGGENAKLLRQILVNLNEYFRRHIGYWATYTGTTDASGRLVITHDCGFEPSAVALTENYVSGSAHDYGPVHVHTHDSQTIDIHFLTKSGQDRASTSVSVDIIFMPPTGER